MSSFDTFVEFDVSFVGLFQLMTAEMLESLCAYDFQYITMAVDDRLLRDASAWERKGTNIPGVLLE